MFGHDDNQQQPAQDNAAAWPAATPDPVADGALDSPATDTTSPVITPDEPSASPPADTPAEEDAISSTPELPASEPEAAAESAPALTALEPASADDLVGLKQQALQHLSPLVSHLDQTPEEKFRTTMMMIQASDDQTLIKSAFEAAQAITDDKARAQALLDVINEINYFTQHTAPPSIN